MRPHAAATLFPMLPDAELASLAADIKQHGLRHPGVELDGLLLDGRNREAACKIARVEFRTEKAPRDVAKDPVSYVVSTNLRRRHLDPEQTAMVGFRVKKMFEEQAAQAMLAGSKKGGETAGRGRPKADSPTAHRQEAKRISDEAASKAAAAVGSSTRSVYRAGVVQTKGTEELIALADAGGITMTAAEKLANRPAPEQRRVVKQVESGALKSTAIVGELNRSERTTNLAAISAGATPLTGALGRFPVIYADPPWRYEHVETESRAIENQYPTMSLDDICAMPVADIATPDAVLFLWVTSPKLEEGMRVVREWGFTYRTSMVWIKDKIGMGYYARQRHEFLLIATRGAPPTPRPADRPDSVIESQRVEHSAKPLSVAATIERMYPEFKRIELFCRSPRENWTAWGNQSAAK